MSFQILTPTVPDVPLASFLLHRPELILCGRCDRACVNFFYSLGGLDAAVLTE